MFCIVDYKEHFYVESNNTIDCCGLSVLQVFVGGSQRLSRTELSVL